MKTTPKELVNLSSQLAMKLTMDICLLKICLFLPSCTMNLN